MKKLSIKTRLALRILLIVVISIALGFTVYQTNVQNLTGDQMPMPLGFGVGVVVSGSMEPHLSVDDMIFVLRSDSYEPGDWIVFQSKGILVVHELISISPDGQSLLTQGTANNTPDDPIQIDQVKGRVAFHLDGAGRVTELIKSPLGTAVILLLAAFLLIMSYKSEKKADDEELQQIRQEIERLKAEADTPKTDKR